jgi:hypothetical protein
MTSSSHPPLSAAAAALDRRAFVRGALSACLATVLAPEALWSATRGGGALRLWIFVPEGSEGLERGAIFGLEEVEQAAALLRREVSGVIRRVAPGGAEEEARQVEGRGGVLVSALAGAGALALDAAAGRHGLLLLNAGDGSRALRARCTPTTLHVAPSEEMRSAAAALAPGAWAEEIAPWHHSLDRFGAGQLNDRYLTRFRQPMPAEAWPVWMAVKIAWEAAARTRSSAGGELAGFLLGPRAHFDGHKGIPLTFRAADRQLRQPLYRAGEGEAVQLPDVRGTAELHPADVLDRLHPGEVALCQDR